MKKSNTLRYFVLILTIFINVFIIYQSCLVASSSTQSASFTINFFKSIINFFSPNLINETNINTFTVVIRKLIGHFGLCAIDGVITTWCIYLYSNNKIKVAWLSLTIGLLVAIITEKIQLFVPGRSGESLDSLIDLIGYVLGYFFTSIIYLIYKKQK